MSKSCLDKYITRDKPVIFLTNVLHKLRLLAKKMPLLLLNTTITNVSWFLHYWTLINIVALLRYWTWINIVVLLDLNQRCCIITLLDLNQRCCIIGFESTLLHYCIIGLGLHFTNIFCVVSDNFKIVKLYYTAVVHSHL